MNVAFLTLGGTGGASSRLRVYQYVPWLEQLGVRCTVLPALPERLAWRLYGRRRRWSNGAYQVAELAFRLAQLVRLDDFDVVVVQKCLLTAGLRGFHRLTGRARVLVVDADDAVHLRPPHRLPRWLGAIEDIGQPAAQIARADHVIAGSEILGAQFRTLNPRVTVVPTSIDTDRFVPDERSAASDPVIGWIGSPSTAGYLDAIVDPLARLGRRVRFVFRVVGAPAPRVPGVRVEERPWGLDREVHDVQSFDIGLMPMPDDPWARGKCGFKAVQYLAVGIPAVCSPVGAAPEIVRHGREGLLANDAEDWERSLHALLTDTKLRRRLGAAGRARAERCYSVRANAPRLAELLTSVATVASERSRPEPGP